MIIDIRDDGDLVIAQTALEHARRGDKVIGITSGCYDLFHNLHLTYLQRCRRMCDVLIVGVDSDDRVKQTKGDNRPIIPEHQRINLISALKCVDIAFIMGSVEDFRNAVSLLKPALIFKNQNFRPQDVVGSDYAKVVTVPDVFQADSTSGIIEEIKRARSRESSMPGIAPVPVVSQPSSPGAFPLPSHETQPANGSVKSPSEGWNIVSPVG